MEIPTIAIVGSETLLAREVRDLLNEQAPHMQVKLVSAEADAAILTERAGEPVVVHAMDEEGLTSAQVACFAGSAESSRECLDILRRARSKAVVLDLSYGLEDHPEARITAPLVESPQPKDAPVPIHVIAHPAAIVLADFFRRLHERFPVRRSVVTILEPASERGKEGIEELQHQAIELLSFKSLPQEIFDAQLAFNILPRYGREAKVDLGTVEARIRRHLTTLLSRMGKIPAPSIRLAQAPVFHGHSFSVWAEFSRAVDAGKLVKALACKQIEVRSQDDEPPANVGVAGQSAISAGCIEVDRGNPKAAWFWLVADNHRIAADNAVCLARLLTPVEGSA